jgi:hypothetical protein
MHDIVTCIPVPRPRLDKHFPARANARKNRTTIDRQRIGKHASLTIEAVFSCLQGTHLLPYTSILCDYRAQRYGHSDANRADGGTDI